MKKPKLSEIRANKEWTGESIYYLLDLVKRLGKVLEQEMLFYENDNPEILEARALLKELEL